MSFNDFFPGLISALFDFLSSFLEDLLTGALNGLLGIGS
jgi:hypothetical protein